MKKVVFIASPLALGLGYSQGESAEFETEKANELIELGLAEVIEETEKPKVEKAEKVVKTEKAVK